MREVSINRRLEGRLGSGTRRGRDDVISSGPFHRSNNSSLLVWWEWI